MSAMSRQAPHFARAERMWTEVAHLTGVGCFLLAAVSECIGPAFQAGFVIGRELVGSITSSRGRDS